MGLAGRRVKQRIGQDPNNLTWSTDTNKFGFRMLERMGWSLGKGLGKDEQGQVEHLKVRLKEDQLGVGADKRTTDNWMINASGFDSVLERLNSQQGSEASSVSGATEEEASDPTQKKTKKAKKEKKDKKDKKAKKGSDSDDTNDDTETKKAPTAVTAVASVRLAHRSKFMRNKRVNGYNSRDLAEILGVRAVSSSAEPTETESEPVEKPSTSEDTPNSLAEAITVSQLSTTDYFAQQLSKAAEGASMVARVPRDAWEDDDTEVRGGIGLGLGCSSSTLAPITFTVASGTPVDESSASTGSDSDKKSKHKDKKNKKDKKDKKSKRKRSAEETSADVDSQASSDKLKKKRKKDRKA